MSELLDGSNRIIFGGPFDCCLSNKEKIKVIADQLVVISKNGGAADLPVDMLKTVKNKVLEWYYEIVRSQKTTAGVNKTLQDGGARMLSNDLFWQKNETTAMTVMPKRREKLPKSVRTLRDLSRKL